MNGLRRDGLDRARALVLHLNQASDPGVDPGLDIVVCPPATLLAEIRSALDGSGIALGGQDCAPAEEGAHTGDISAKMLADAGCRYVIVGHSERRERHGENDALVRAKAEAAHRAGLVTLVCVGETQTERDAGRTLRVVGGQTEASLPEDAGPDNTVLVYEPVWAIGTGRTPTVAEIGEVQSHLRGLLRGRSAASADAMRLLYGGSVEPANAREVISIGDVDGFLVGGAALAAGDFWAICESCV